MKQKKQFYCNIRTLTPDDSGGRTRWIVTWLPTGFSPVFYFKNDPKTSVIPSSCMSSTILRVVFSSCFFLVFVRSCDLAKFLAWNTRYGVRVRFWFWSTKPEVWIFSQLCLVHFYIFDVMTVNQKSEVTNVIIQIYIIHWGLMFLARNSILRLCWKNVL